MEFINKSGLEFTDVSSEQWRRYKFATGEYVIIRSPLWLHVSESGGHRILDGDGVSHYVPPTWIHLYWKAKEDQPHFVK